MTVMNIASVSLLIAGVSLFTAAACAQVGEDVTTSAPAKANP